MSIRSGSVVLIVSLLSGMACSAQAADAQSWSAGFNVGRRGQDARSVQRNVDDFLAMVESDPKLDVPYTPKAQKYVAAYKFKRDIPYAQDGCMSPGLPIAMRAGPIKFTYAPGLISIYMQAVGNTRFVRMNQEQGKTSPKYYGNSVGHWEGDTLVIETTDFLPEITFQYGIGKGLPRDGTSRACRSSGVGPGRWRVAVFRLAVVQAASAPAASGDLSKAIWGPHGEGMHMVERMRLVNPRDFGSQPHALRRHRVDETLCDGDARLQPHPKGGQRSRAVQRRAGRMGLHRIDHQLRPGHQHL